MEAVNIINKAKNIIILCGAGISVSCGIPDFRSSTGLYNTLNASSLGLLCAEDLFDLDFFVDNPAPFYRFSAQLFPGTIKPSRTHEFLALLEQRRKLLRCYTQNIDNLEHLAGVSDEKLVFAHGSLRAAQCLKCKNLVDASKIKDNVTAGTVPYCTSKKRKLVPAFAPVPSLAPAPAPLGLPPPPPLMRRKSSRQTSTSSSTGNSSDHVNFDATCCNGVLKPTVTFFGEKLDDSVAKSLNSDKTAVDCLIVLGTSLSVAPMSRVVSFLPPNVPRILINKNEIKLDTAFTESLLGDCDDVVEFLMDRLNWNNSNDNDEDDNDNNNNNIIINPTEVRSDCHVFCKEGGATASTVPMMPMPTTTTTTTVNVLCDGCSDTIEQGTFYNCCKTCFDHDLCTSCHKERKTVTMNCSFVLSDSFLF